MDRAQLSDGNALKLDPMIYRAKVLRDLGEHEAANRLMKAHFRDAN